MFIDVDKEMCSLFVYLIFQQALWIFEIALLISDAPHQLSELQRIGNYNCLSPLGHLGFFSNALEYYKELGRHVMLYHDTVENFNEELIAIAMQVSEMHLKYFLFLQDENSPNDFVPTLLIFRILMP